MHKHKPPLTFWVSLPILLGAIGYSIFGPIDVIVASLQSNGFALLVFPLLLLPLIFVGIPAGVLLYFLYRGYRIAIVSAMLLVVPIMVLLVLSPLVKLVSNGHEQQLLVSLIYTGVIMALLCVEAICIRDLRRDTRQV